MSLIRELQRRNVLRVGAAYIVTAWLIVQVVETLFPVYGLSDEAIRMVVNVLAIGLIPVLVLSWVFEWTPQGLKRDAEVDHGTEPSVDAARRLDRVILVVLALALGYFAFDKFVLAPQLMERELAEAREMGRSEAVLESYGDRTIAVLAFEDMSPGRNQEYFSDGISEEILNLLAKIPELRVTSRSSAFNYKGRDVPLTEIGDELKVAHILEGSVRWDGDRIRITAQLIDTRTDTHLWSENFDRVLDDVFAIQDEIAAEVVENLQIKLTGSVPTARRTNPEVLDLTLQVRQKLQTPHTMDKEEVYRLVDRALELDPDYVPAMEIRVLLDFTVAVRDGLIEEHKDTWHQWRDRILALDPDNPTIRGYMAWDLYLEEHDIEGAVREIVDSLEAFPNELELLRSGAGIARRIGKYDQAQKLSHRCVDLDPLMHLCTWQLKESYLVAQDLVNARKYLDRLHEYWGQPIRIHDGLLMILEGRREEARKQIEAWGSSGFQTDALLALMAHDEGNIAERDRLIAGISLEESAKDFTFRLMNVAGIYAHSGMPDEAFAMLDRAWQADPQAVFLDLFGPWLWKLYDDPRWDELRERAGLSKKRIDAIEFDLSFLDE